MKIESISGFATITSDPAASKALYKDTLSLPLKEQQGYLSVDNFEGSKHFAVWPLPMAAQSCFGSETWPEDVPVPHATIEFEFSSAEAVTEAVEEMKQRGYLFLHEARLEPWGQTVARLMSPEGLLLGLSFAPWMHETEDAPAS